MTPAAAVLTSDKGEFRASKITMDKDNNKSFNFLRNNKKVNFARKCNNLNVCTSKNINSEVQNKTYRK